MKRTFILLLLLACTTASLAQLSGPLSGTLGPGTYTIVGDIFVNLGDSLRLTPGTTFDFVGTFSFRIYGTLLAEGTLTDSIMFTSDQPVWNGWHGLHFSGVGSSGSRLRHCIIRNAYLPWGGIGGGVYADYNSSPVFSGCTITCNSATYGGGVFCISSSPTFIKCTLIGNSADYGGGVFSGENSSPSFTNCTIAGNSAYVGGGVYCTVATPTFNSTIIAFCEGEGIYFAFSGESQFLYCDIFGNSGGNITFHGNNPPNGPPAIGRLSRTNANGDSCDRYCNIFLNPMFVSAVDFHLLAGSPCIDAGDPTLPLDLDNTIADIGAYYYHQSAAEPLAAVLLPKTYALHPNWPNPFNSSTMIRYDVPQAGKVSLTIFNLLGQRVATLFDGRQLAGSYTINWSASNLPSGLYLCRMEAARFAQTRKLVLVK